MGPNEAFMIKLYMKTVNGLTEDEVSMSTSSTVTSVGVMKVEDDKDHLCNL